MSLDTYSNLQTEIAEWLNRDDLTAKIPTFITLTEAEMNRVLRRSTTKTSVSITAEENDVLPTNFREMLTLTLSTSQADLDKPMVECTLAELADVKARASGISTRPTHFAVANKKLYVAPVPDQTYTATLFYGDGVTALSGSNAYNDELLESPDLYLFGALSQAAPYLEHDERIPVWREKFQRAIDQHNGLRDDESYGGEIKEARLPVVFGF